MLNSLELEYLREFKITDDDMSVAIDKADTYGTTLVDFRFVSRYFLLIFPEAIWCYPTSDPDATLSKFLEHYNRDNKKT